MRNVIIEIATDGIATITIDLNAERIESSSGKTMVIATTNGNVPLPDSYHNIRLGINVFESKPKQGDQP